MQMLTDCDACRAGEPEEIRRRIGCAYLPPSEDARPWSCEGAPADLKTCPGFTTLLPEVTEAARARRHWTHGELRSFCHGQPCDEIMMAVEILDGAASALEAHEAEKARPS